VQGRVSVQLSGSSAMAADCRMGDHWQEDKCVHNGIND
jgi:hypothetical protein